MLSQQENVESVGFKSVNVESVNLSQFVGKLHVNLSQFHNFSVERCNGDLLWNLIVVWKFKFCEFVESDLVEQGLS